MAARKPLSMQKLKTLAAVALLVLVAASCSKDDPVYPFRIIAVNEEGVRLQNAEVRASVPLPNVKIEYNGITGTSGRVDFIHEGGEVVLQVQVVKGGTTPAAVGCGFIKLEPDQMVTTTITVTEYDPNDPGCQ